MDEVREVRIVDHGMALELGHNHAYNLAFGNAFRELGLPVRYFFADKMPEDLLREHYPAGTACFSWSLYYQMSKSKDSEEFFLRSAASLQAELHSFLDPGLTAATLVFAHSLDPSALLGFALWYADCPEERRPHLALSCMLEVDDSPQCRLHLEAACSMLRDCPEARLFGGTRSVARMLAEYTGRQCSMLPTPLPKQPENYHVRTCPEQPVFGLIGNWRRGKNLQILPTALALYLSRGGQGTFYLQMTPTDKQIHPVCQSLHDVSARFPDKVCIDLRYLGTHEYYQLLSLYSALIVPYTAEGYSCFRPSGLVIESAALAVPAICVRGGFMQEELAPLQNGSLFIAEPSARCLADAFFRFEGEMMERKAAALAAAPEYCRFHDIWRFAEQIIGTIQGKA